jgi:hypothetical protein
VFHPKGPSLVELAQQAFSGTNQGYDLLAPKFDLTPFRTPDDLLDQIAPYLGAPGSAADGLDLCTGTGAAMRVLHPVCTTTATGIDRSQGMLDGARLQSFPVRPPSTGSKPMHWMPYPLNRSTWSPASARTDTSCAPSNSPSPTTFSQHFAPVAGTSA